MEVLMREEDTHNCWYSQPLSDTQWPNSGFVAESVPDEDAASIPKTLPCLHFGPNAAAKQSWKQTKCISSEVVSFGEKCTFVKKCPLSVHFAILKKSVVTCGSFQMCQTVAGFDFKTPWNMSHVTMALEWYISDWKRRFHMYTWETKAHICIHLCVLGWAFRGERDACMY